MVPLTTWAGMPSNCHCIASSAAISEWYVRPWLLSPGPMAQSVSFVHCFCGPTAAARTTSLCRQYHAPIVSTTGMPTVRRIVTRRFDPRCSRHTHSNWRSMTLLTPSTQQFIASELISKIFSVCRHFHSTSAQSNRTGRNREKANGKDMRSAL